MAEFLVMNRDNRHPDPQLDETDIFKTGDIVDVFPDGKLGPDAHANGTFIIVRVPGLDPEVTKDYLSPEEADMWNDTLGQLQKRKVRLRSWHIPVSALPQSIIDQVKSGVYDFTFTLQQIRNYVQRKLAA